MEGILRIITCSFLSWLEKILFGGNERDLKFSEWDFFFLMSMMCLEGFGEIMIIG